MRIEVSNHQRTHRLRAGAIRTFVKWVMARACREVRNRPWAEVSVAIVGDGQIRRVNGEHLGHDEVTDVISFVYAPPAGAEGGLSGEVIVNADRAVSEARERRLTPSVELARYLAHGCQHLCGATDRTALQRLRMRRRETRWIREARKLGPLDLFVA